MCVVRFFIFHPSKQTSPTNNKQTMGEAQSRPSSDPWEMTEEFPIGKCRASVYVVNDVVDVTQYVQMTRDMCARAPDSGGPIRTALNFRAPINRPGDDFVLVPIKSPTDGGNFSMVFAIFHQSNDGRDSPTLNPHLYDEDWIQLTIADLIRRGWTMLLQELTSSQREAIVARFQTPTAESFQVKSPRLGVHG